MSPKILLNPKRELKNIKNGKHIIPYILEKMREKPLSGVELIGISANYMIAVFNLEKTVEGYIGKRIYPDSDGELLISDVGYAITNLGTPSTITCDIDYIVTPEILNIKK